MKVRAIIELIEREGRYLARTRGDHKQYKHPFKKGLVTIGGHSNDDIGKSTLNSILKQAGLQEGGKGA